MKLHIGGQELHPDWKIFDIENRPEVDYVGDASDLSQFEDESIEVIYASHILEHFHHSLDNEVIFALAEWHRVLKQGGQLMISVPDLQTLCWLYLRPDIDVTARLHFMRIIFGGQTNQYDIHKVGFDYEILGLYLAEVGFKQYERVRTFDLFNDCSGLNIMGNLISLNVIATK